MESPTTDTFFDGRLHIRQSRSGYRFSLDAVLLASSFEPRPGEKILDLGTGCGIVPLLVGFRHPDVRFWAVEVQKDLARLAAENAALNRMQNRIAVMRVDLKSLKPQQTCGPVDRVVCNPPYRRANSGRMNPVREKAIARHEIAVTLDDIVQTARRMLKTAGRLVLVHTAERLADIFPRLRSSGIEPKFLRTVHSTMVADARLILVEASKGARPGLTIRPPLVVFDADGEYTAEVAAMFR
jgi:tRNA1Val (adenine37-N6)-methyltransferase